MSLSSLGGLVFGTFLVVTSYAVPIAPGATLAERGRCKDENGFIVGSWRDCSQLVPAVTLPPVDHVWRREKPGPDDIGPKGDGTTEDEALVYPRDEYTHVRAPYIYTVPPPQEISDDAGSGSGNLPTTPGNDKTSTPGQSQPRGIEPGSKMIGVSKVTLPVEKPVSMGRRNANGEHVVRADIVTHEPTDEIWRRDDKAWETDQPHIPKQSKPHPDTSTPESFKSEAEQLFEQSRSADKNINLNEAKLTIMRLADDLYRRGVPDTMSPGGGRPRMPTDTQPPSSYQGSGGADLDTMNIGKLITLYPAGGLYRRSQNVEAVGQNVESISQNVESASQNGAGNVAAIKNLYENLAALQITGHPTFEEGNRVSHLSRRSKNVATASQNVELTGQNVQTQNGGENTAIAKSLFDTLTALNGEDQLRPRSQLPPPEAEVLRYRPWSAYNLPTLYQRGPGASTVFKDIKDKLDKVKPALGGDSSSGSLGNGGDSASGGDTAKSRPGQSDSKTPSDKRSIPTSDLEAPEPEIVLPSPSDAFNHTSPEQQAYDEALKGMREALTQFIELCKNPVVLEHLKTDSVEKCQSKVRKALKHVNSKDSTGSLPGSDHGREVESVLNTIFARDIGDDEKEQKDKDREAEVSLRAWQKYQDTCGGLLAFACEPKCSPSDPWPCIPQPAWAHQPTTIVQKRGHEATPVPKADYPKLAPAQGEVPGTPKYVVLGRLKTVYRRDVPSIDQVLPEIPTPYAHKQVDRVFRRGEEVYVNHQPDSEDGATTVPWYHLKAPSVVGVRPSQFQEKKQNSLAARRVKPSPSPKPMPKSAPIPPPELPPIMPEPVSSTPIAIEDDYPPKYRLKVPADSAIRTTMTNKGNAQKRSADDEWSTTEDSIYEDDYVRDWDGPRYEAKRPAPSVYRIEGKEDGEGMTKRGHGERVFGSGIEVSGNLPVVLGMAGDVHRRDDTSGSEEVSGDEVKERKENRHDPTKTSETDDTPGDMVKRTICNPGLGACAHEPIGSVYNEVLENASDPQPIEDPIPASPLSRIDVRKRCYNTPWAEYCHSNTAPDVFHELGKNERRDDVEVPGGADTSTGDVKGDVPVGNGSDGDEKEKKKKAKEHDKAKKKLGKESEKKGDSA